MSLVVRTNRKLFGINVDRPLLTALALFGTSPICTTSLLVAWDFFGTTEQVGWGACLSRALSSEAGGGLVAVIQFAITAGAAPGGLLFDVTGWPSAFLLASILLMVSSLMAFAAWLDWNCST
jgi:predicted MFS family arabinose efflux permease